jgi:hypothetical protein
VSDGWPTLVLHAIRTAVSKDEAPRVAHLGKLQNALINGVGASAYETAAGGAVVDDYYVPRVDARRPSIASAMT